MMKKAAAVIVYNPDLSIVDNVLSFCSHVNKVYLWLNSPLTVEITHALENALGDKLYWCGDKSNKGIGLALNTILKKCSQENIQWLLTMDQDSKFRKDDVALLSDFIDSIQDDSSIALVSANHTVSNKIEHNTSETYRWVMMSGNFINVCKSIDVGGFEESFFIDGVDIDFCLRLRKKGYLINVQYEAKLEHKLGETKEVYIFGYKTRTTNHNPIRLYYIFRNYPRIVLSSVCDCIARRILLKFLVHKIFCVLFAENNKANKIKMMFKGFYDFLLNRSGVF